MIGKPWQERVAEMRAMAMAKHEELLPSKLPRDKGTALMLIGQVMAFDSLLAEFPDVEETPKIHLLS